MREQKLDLSELDYELVSDPILRKWIRERLNGSLGQENLLISELAKHLSFYTKTDLKKLVKQIRKPSEPDLEEKACYVIADRVLKTFNIITFKDSRIMMCFGKNSYTFDLSKVEEFISSLIRELNLSHITNFNEVLSYIEKQTLIDVKEMNFSPYYIPFRNGTVVFYKEREGEYIADFAPPDKSYKFFYEIPHEFKYDRVYRCPRFKRALRTWLTCEKNPFPKVRVRDIFEAIGLCMTANMNFKTAFLNYGPKHSGKTQFFNIVVHIIGKENMSFTSLQRLGKDQFGGSKLFFKILNFHGDIPSTKIRDSGLFKDITGADCVVEGEKKFKPSFEFYPTNKFWFNANRIPRFADWNDSAVYARFILFNFPNIFAEGGENTEMAFANTIIQDPEEVQGIIHESIKGYIRLLNREFFRRVLKKNTKHIWDYNSDDFYAFIYDHCEEDKDAMIQVDDFLDKFTDYFPGYKKNSITINLERLGIKKRERTDPVMPKIGGKRNKSYFYVGIKWKEGDDLELLDVEQKEDEETRDLRWLGLA